MTKASAVYQHKRDLYSDVTARILAELQTGAAPLAQAMGCKFYSGSITPYRMPSPMMRLKVTLKRATATSISATVSS